MPRFKGHIHAHSDNIHVIVPMQVFMRMGLPQVVVSDQGREFNNNLDSELAKCLGITRRLTTPYHPQVLTGICAHVH